MKHSDFHIGLVFYTHKRWRCTDVGTRVIVAIEISPEQDESWRVGPPYAVAEYVFDEHDMPGCALLPWEAVDADFGTVDDEKLLEGVLGKGCCG